MKLFNLLARFAVCLFLAASMAHAQGVGASGDIRGLVTDPSGAVVSNATVEVVDVAKNTKRTSSTDSSGQYHVTGLLPSIYSVSVAHSGFQTEIQKNLVVTIGETSILDFHLKVSSVAESLEVTTEAPVVDVERTGQANTITSQLVQDLPINRRDYLTFTLLAPGVTDSTRLSGDQDFRVKQTPQSGLSFYGSNGRGNTVTVDGGEANDDSGGVRLTISQDAVQEFQINRSNYNAELGGASGAAINIVSKTGTNDVHGSVYGFFRNDVFDARNPFSFSQALQPGQTFNPANPDSVGTPTKDTLSRQQFGATVGFPIKKDKTFIFAAFEALRQNAQNAVPLLTNTSVFRPNGGQQSILSGLLSQPNNPVPCLTGQPAIPSAVCAGILNNVLTINPAASPLKAFIVNQFENNGGVFAYKTREYQVSGRLDHQFSDKNQAYLRYSFAHDLDENPDVQSLTGFSRGSSIHAYDNTAQAAWFHQFSAKTQNEARAQFNYTNFSVVPNFLGEVGLDIPGFANLGTNIFLPSFTIMRRWEFADNFTMIRGKHTLKFGGYELLRGNHTESHTFFPGRFVFGNLPGGILSPCLQVPAACATGAGSSLLTAFPTPINSIQSVSLGLPQFYNQGFGNPIYNYPRPWTAAYAQDSWAIKPNFTFNFGLRYELDAQYGRLNTDKDNFAPRASFAWDPFKDHKTVVRAGYGIFYSPVYGQIADVVQTLGNINGLRPIANFLLPLTGAPGAPPGLTSAAIFQTLFAQGKVQCTTPAPGNAACITPADLAQFGLNISNTGPNPPLTVLFNGQPDYQNPYSQQAEVGIEREITPGFSVSLSGVYVHTLRLPIAIDQNNLPGAPFQSALLANGQTVSFRNWGAPQCTSNPFSCFANPTLLQNNFYSSKGSALYEGGILEVKKRFNNYFTLMGNYTLSKAFDTSTDFNSDFGPQDQTNLAAERALSTFDQRHKIVVAAVLDSPWRGGKNASMGQRIFSGFQLSPIIRYNSGHPFNLLAGTNVNNDRHSTNDRPIGAARNTGQGPDYFDVDMRLTRQFRVSEKASVQFMVEGFNLFNRTNFGAVNNVVGPNFALPKSAGGAGFTTFNVSGSNIGPSIPLGFTSALPRRQLQFGARLAF
ncbi:MAG TPA: TonB-dependent receptor [Candidatus Solibacter sp.]|nr:TonB-dependent receptor [Candidatus Solibacter sp.]